MLIADILFVIILALVLSALLSGPVGWRHPGGDDGPAVAVFLFLLLGLGMLVSAAWLGQIGPPVGGVYWAAPSVTGLILVLLLLALAAPAAAPDETEAKGESRPALAAVGAVFSVFVWVLLVTLALLVVAGAL